MPILTESWPWLQHHLNISLLGLQKPTGNLTTTCFPGSPLTSCFCSHPEIGSRKQTKTFIWTFQAFCIILFFSLKNRTVPVIIGFLFQSLLPASPSHRPESFQETWTIWLSERQRYLHTSVGTPNFLSCHTGWWWLLQLLVTHGACPLRQGDGDDSADDGLLSALRFQHCCSQCFIRREWRGRQQEVSMS